MRIRLGRETKIIFAVLGLVILAAIIFIAANFRQLRQSNLPVQYLGAKAKDSNTEI